jgi:hypothetical protein
MPLYELALLGEPTDIEINGVEAYLSRVIALFGLQLGIEIGWQRKTARFDPSASTSSAAAFFGCPGAPSDSVADLLKHGIPVIPIAQSPRSISVDLPEILRPFSCCLNDLNCEAALIILKPSQHLAWPPPLNPRLEYGRDCELPVPHKFDNSSAYRFVSLGRSSKFVHFPLRFILFALTGSCPRFDPVAWECFVPSPAQRSSRHLR